MPPFAVRSTTDHLAADQLDAWCTLFEGCTRIAALVPRQHATALGVIQRLRLVPDEAMQRDIRNVVYTAMDALRGILVASFFDQDAGRARRRWERACENIRRIATDVLA